MQDISLTPEHWSLAASILRILSIVWTPICEAGKRLKVRLFSKPKPVAQIAVEPVEPFDPIGQVTITLPTWIEADPSLVYMRGTHKLPPKDAIFWIVGYDNAKGFWPKMQLTLRSNGTWEASVHCGRGPKKSDIRVVWVSQLMHEFFKDAVARGDKTEYWAPLDLHPTDSDLRFVDSVVVHVAAPAIRLAS